MDGLYKIIQLEERFPTTGEPTIQVLTRADLARVKLASEAGDYVKTVQPVPGKTIVLVLAMSAGEYWGPNRNGDAFAERPVPGKVEKGETLPDHFKTFESNAHVYRHHVNKDPAKALGKVLRAFYNYDMHRVELLLELDNHIGADVVDKIQAGEFPAVSMGCKIKYDVCDICGNKAPTRAQYCDHAKYEMNRTYPDGRKSFVWNPSPQLFDISFVIRPADRIGYMMKKVAHVEPAADSSAELGDKVADIQEKMSTLKKLSDIDKIIRGQTVDHEPKNGPIQSFVQHSLPGILKNTPDFDQDAINNLSSVPLPEALSTLNAMGITPTCVEITRIMINRASPGAELPTHVQDNLGDFSGAALNLMQQHPEILHSVLNSGLLDLGQDKVNPQLAQKMAGWMEKRSNFKEWAIRRVSIHEPHPDVGVWDQTPVQDPATGMAGVATRGSMNAADDAVVKRQLKTLAGAGLLTGAAYKVLSAHPGGRAAAPLAAAAGVLGTGTLMHRYRPMRISEGEPVMVDNVIGEKWQGGVPMNAEFKQAAAFTNGALSFGIPLAGSAAATSILAQEYRKRLDQGSLGMDPRWHQRAVEGLGSTAYRHPAASFLAGLASIGFGGHVAGQASKFIKGASDDGVKMAEVDLDGLVSWLGEGLFALEQSRN
jgi:hypothetical protein